MTMKNTWIMKVGSWITSVWIVRMNLKENLLIDYDLLTNDLS
jgi:hypothetical protein